MSGLGQERSKIVRAGKHAAHAYDNVVFNVYSPESVRDKLWRVLRELQCNATQQATSFPGRFLPSN